MLQKIRDLTCLAHEQIKLLLDFLSSRGEDAGNLDKNLMISRLLMGAGGLSNIYIRNLLSSHKFYRRVLKT